MQKGVWVQHDVFRRRDSLLIWLLAKNQKRLPIRTCELPAGPHLKDPLQGRPEDPPPLLERANRVTVPVYAGPVSGPIFLVDGRQRAPADKSGLYFFPLLMNADRASPLACPVQLIPVALVEKGSCQRREREGDRCFAYSAHLGSIAQRHTWGRRTTRPRCRPAICKDDCYRCSSGKVGNISARVRAGHRPGARRGS